MKNKKTIPNLSRVAIYIRVSTDRQAKKGDSMDEQKDTCMNYINSKEDLILQGIYIDDGISGQKLKRGDFAHLMENVRSGLIDLIIFTKLDRWFRSLRHYLNTQATLEEYGVNWLAVSQPYFDTSTPHGRAFIAQSMTFAELEAQNDSERILAVFDYKYKHGEVLSGTAPFGFSIVNKRLQPNEDAPKVLRIFQHYALTSSINSTTQFMMNEFGIVRTCPTVRKLLKNAKYIGLYRDNPNFCPPIVPEDLFYDVQRKLSMNVKRSQVHDYIFSGLVRCADCGYAYSGALHRGIVNGKPYEYAAYRCSHAYPRKLCPNRKYMFEKRLETYVLENVKPLLSQYIVEYETKSAPAVNASKKRSALMGKIEKLKELFVNGLITLDEYKTDKATYQAEIEALSDAAEPEKNLDALRDFLALDLDAIYGTLDAKEKRTLWRSVIHEIRIDSDKNIEIVFL